jgi:hypothetical protein
MFTNPDTTQQAGDIYLQNTNVYYCPMTPPDAANTRDSLCNESDLLRDPNGVGDQWRTYLPFTHGRLLKDMHRSCGDTSKTLGIYAVWQRFFTARDKPNQSLANRHSDIIVGSAVSPDTTVSHGPVIISKNEDVDFRASGTIRMEAGFHVMPGAFFHAYIEPKWGDTVFNDEFTGPTLDRSKWYVANGWGDDYGMGANCSYDSNVRIDTDYEAHDGHALDIILREDTNTCSCQELGYSEIDSCLGSIHGPVPVIHHYLFSTAVVRSCPWPWTTREGTLGSPMYQNAPYGKYEVRDKIPHIPHYMNSFGGGTFEWDMNEINTPGYMKSLHPGLGLHFRYGPVNGTFGLHGSDTVFRSAGAEWSWTNAPVTIFIDSFPYPVEFHRDSSGDAYVKPGPGTYHMYGGFPSFLTGRSGSISFYYERSEQNVTDPLHWTVTLDSARKRRIFSAPYHGSLHFWKMYQPTSVTLTVNNISHAKKTINCHWVDSLNHPDLGLLRLDDTLLPSDLDSNTERYTYTIREGNFYPMPPFSSNIDTGAYDTTRYVYHTFGMELLPHEVRYLMDSNVVCRMPDRLIPVGNRSYNWASRIPRSPVNIHPITFEIHLGGYDSLNVSYTDSLGTHPGTITYVERKYFEAHDTTCPGCWKVKIGGKWYPAAHHLVDYFKVWNMPADAKISQYPH